MIFPTPPSLPPEMFTATLSGCTICLFVLWPPSMINGAVIGVELITFVALLRQIEGFAGCKYGPAAADTKRQGKTKNVLKK